ncbi:CADPS2 family protein [Megaselia abdita]
MIDPSSSEEDVDDEDQIQKPFTQNFSSSAISAPPDKFAVNQSFEESGVGNNEPIRYKAHNGHLHTNKTSTNGYHQNGYDEQHHHYQPPTSSHFYATTTNANKKKIDHNSIPFGYHHNNHNDHHHHEKFYKLNGSNKQNHLNSSSHSHNRTNLFQSISSQSATDGGANSSVAVSSGQNSLARPATSRPMSPSPSTVSEKHGDPQEREDRDEQDRKQRIQLYVFVSRCIAYPFNAKQPNDVTKRHTKVNKTQLDQITQRFNAFLKGETQIIADEAFQNAVQSYMEVFLKSDRVIKMVTSGCATQFDFKEVFRTNIEKRVRSLPEIEGISKETVLTSWLAKFDILLKGAGDEENKRPTRLQPNLNSELILNKEQLYDMFQQILGVKKFEHQILYNALMLDSSDEQAAAIRRELDGRMAKVVEMEKNRKLMPKFVLKEMDVMYIEELKASINLLMANLEMLPVNKGAAESKYGLPKFKKGSSGGSFLKMLLRQQGSLVKLDESGDCDSHLSKLDVVLTFQLEVIVMEVKGLKSLPANKIVYCTMEVENGEKLQTDQAEASKPMWDTQADFTTTHPLPVVKIKLYTENSSLVSLDDMVLGKIVLRPTPLSTKSPEWHRLVVPKNLPDQDMRIKVACRMDKPLNMKHCGFLLAIGKSVWKKWKKRYFVLVQVSQYTFAMCSYKEKKSEPSEMMQLDGYTVDYIEAASANLMFGIDLDGGKFFFNAVKEGESVLFACDDENECSLWVMALYRATGQAHKPTPPVIKDKNTTMSKIQGDADKARKHGMEDFISADPCTFDHTGLYKFLQKLTLEYRVNDPFASMGWFSPGQVFILDEYCARYGVRGCFRHLFYLSDLLDKAEKGMLVDPTLIHFSFAFCASHVHGNRPDGIGSITHEEREKFNEVRERLRTLLENQITNFRYCFPFGRPEGSLKATISLLERVLMKDIVTPVQPEETRQMIKKCLENAALINYNKLSKEAKIEEDFSTGAVVPPSKKLEDLIHLAELCVDLLQQNEEHYAEAFAWFSDLLVEHAEIFWALFAVDMDRVLVEQEPDTWDSFPLFQILNDYLRVDDNLKHGRFHQHLREIFAPLVVRYVDLMETSITQSIHKGFEKEKWESKGRGCATTEDLFWKLDALQSFIKDLYWPDQDFAQHLEQRLKLMACDMIEQCIYRIDSVFQSWLKKNVAFISTDYLIPPEMCAMINIILDAKNQSFKLCTVDGVDMFKYHAKIDEELDKTNNGMLQGLIGKLLSVLESTLSKLSRFDEGNLIGSILNFTNVSNSGKDIGQLYVQFFTNNMEIIRQKITDDLWLLVFFEQWYTQQINMLCNWLSERIDHSLHFNQCTSLSHIVKKVYSEFELSGVMEDKLNSKAYQTVASRMATEEATCALTMPDMMSDADGPNVENESNSSGASSSRPKLQPVSSALPKIGQVGNILGKGIGGISSKLGGGGWF